MDIKTEIINHINIRSYYEKFITIIDETSTNYRSTCPFHDEKDGSFFVEKTTGNFHCFGCKKNGDIVSFQMAIRNEDFKTAIKTLAAECNLDLGEEFGGSKKTKKPKLSVESIDAMHSALDVQSWEYLNSRGVSNETINKLKIGQWGSYIVFPIFKDNIPYNLRFYQRKTASEEKRIWQLSQKELGHNPIWLFPEPELKEDILLCEGEIDCLSAISLGYNATTITGGAGTWFDDFASIFKDRTVNICYDIDDPGVVGSKLIATKIAKVAKLVRIVALELDIEKYPNGDFNDYIIKEKKTKQDFDLLIKNATIQVVIDDDIKVVENKGCYWNVTENRKGEISYNKITNFTIRLQAKHHQEQENGIDIEREIILIGSSGEVSQPILARAENLSSIRDFKTMVIRKGGFVFDGSDSNLSDICKLIFAQNPNKEIYTIKTAGYCKEKNIWIFKNMAIHNEQIFEADENGICWNEKHGYRCMPLSDKLDDNVNVPSISLFSGEKNLSKFSNLLAENFGNPLVKLGVGLFLGSIYFDTILNKFGSFPIMFVYGQKESGKTEYVGILMKMLGMYRSFAESMPGAPSIVGTSRKLAYYSCLPVWVDEYRIDLPSIEKFQGFFRTVFDGTGRTLGKKSGGAATEKIKSSLIISGQDKPSDGALLSRLVMINLKAKHRKNELHSQVIELAEKCGGDICDIIVNKEKRSNDLISKIISIKDKILGNQNKNEKIREATDYAIAAGCYSFFVEEDPIIEDHVVNNLNDLLATCDSVSDGDIDNSELQEVIDEIGDFAKNINGWFRFTQNGELIIAFGQLYQKWAENRNRIGSKVIPVKEIYTQMKDMPGYIAHGVLQRIDEKENGRKCLVLDPSRVPNGIKSWFGSINWPTNNELPLVDQRPVDMSTGCDKFS